MDKRLLIFVALIYLSRPSYGRSWLGSHEYHSDNGFPFKPYNHDGYRSDQNSEYESSSEEDWNRGDGFTDHHRHPEEYQGHGYHHHVNHGHHYGSHVECDYPHHDHGYSHDFRNGHNYGSHYSHKDQHNHNPALGSNYHNHNGYRPNNQDYGHNNDESDQSHGTFDLPRNSQGNRNNEPNTNPRAVDQNHESPDVGSSNTESSNDKIPVPRPTNSEAPVRPSESGFSVTDPPNSGLPAGSPDLPQGRDSMSDSDRVVFPDSPPSPITTITSSPLEPRLLSTPDPMPEAPSQDLTTQVPVTQVPEQASTPALLDVVKCVRACPVTSEYNPVCGSNNVTYNNPGLLQCARNCGVNVTTTRQVPCPRALPLPVLRLLADTFNVTLGEVSPRTKRDTPGNAVTPAKTPDTVRKAPIDPKDLPKLNFTLIEVLESAFDNDLELLKKLKSKVKSRE